MSYQSVWRASWSPLLASNWYINHLTYYLIRLWMITACWSPNWLFIETLKWNTITPLPMSSWRKKNLPYHNYQYHLVHLAWPLTQLQPITYSQKKHKHTMHENTALNWELQNDGMLRVSSNDHVNDNLHKSLNPPVHIHTPFSIKLTIKLLLVGSITLPTLCKYIRVNGRMRTIPSR